VRKSAVTQQQFIAIAPKICHSLVYGECC